MRKVGHIRKRSDNSYEIRISMGRDPASGKRRLTTATVRGSRQDAEKELRRLLRAVDTGENVEPSRMTVAQWLHEWLTAVEHEISPKSHERYTEIVENFLIPELGALRLNKLLPPHIQAAYAKWAKGGRRDRKPGGLSPATRRYIHRVLRVALARAVEQQVLMRNPADTFRNRLPKAERKQMVTLTETQSAKLLAGLAGTAIYWPALIALATGMRRGEILALRWCNVDAERREIRVVESLEQTKAGLRFKPPKTDRSRAIALPAFLCDTLRQHKTTQAEELLRLGIRQTPETLVCCDPEGSPVQPRTLTHAFTREIARMKDVPRVRFHDLRHTHATQLLAAGVHPKIAQERLGHSTISTTLDLYTHATATLQEDAASRLDAALGNAISRFTASK